LIGRFLAALIATILIGGVGAFVLASLLPPVSQRAPERPTPPPRSGYVIEIMSHGGEWVATRIDEDAVECEALQSVERLYRACVLATNEDIQLIAGEAFGRLNSEYTDALEAIIWRGRIENSSDVCADAGLEWEFLETCEMKVSQGEYVVGSGDLSDRVRARPAGR
jgi:hypothetical protein